MTLSEAQKILAGSPTAEEVERVAREYITENPNAESIRTPDGKQELMAFALRSWDDEVPTQYSYKQKAWAPIKDDGDERFFTLVRTSPEMRANMVRDLRDAGYKLLIEHADEHGNPQIGIDGDHEEEICARFRNVEWYAGATTASKGSNFFKNAEKLKVQDAAVSYSEPFKVSPILWGMRITEGGVTSTIYARSKGDLLRTAKQRGYEPEVYEAVKF